MDYNSAAIRKLLQDALSEEELTSLCYDYFRPVYDQFSTGMSRLQKAQRLIEYCERREQLGALLARVREINPNQVRKVEASLGGPVAPPAASPAPVPPPPAADRSADLEHIHSLLDIKQRRLNVLEKQKAAMGDLTPAHIVMEVDTLTEEINRYKVQLGLTAPPVANPAPTASTPPPAAPLPAPQKAIFVSYAWGGESEAIVDQLDQAFQASGITIIRDKRDLGYKGRIKNFMEQIGRGKAVIVVISKKYLESENCMFELVQIAKNDQFYDRVFPIVLADANIYKPIQRLKYVQYWEAQIKELDEGMKSVNSANLQGFREAIDLYTEIRAVIAELTATLKDMNTLTVDMHREADFEQLIEAVEQKIAED